MRKNGLRVVKLLTTVFAAAVMFACVSTTSLAYTETEGKITVDTAKIRESADTGSSVKGMVDKGSTVTIIDETTDSSGTLWYQVKTSDATGYIRSDLLEKGQPIASDAGETVSSVDGVSGMASQYAEVAVDSGKLRADASTKDSIVVTMSKGDQVIVDGQKTGSDGKTWYHVTVVGNDGSAYDGFMRNDLVTLGEMVPVEEPVEEYSEEEYVEEAPVEAAPVSQDYETVYTDDGTGNNVWYLYDHTSNSRMKLEDLLSYVDNEAKRLTSVDALAKKLKIALIVLGVLFLIALVAIVVLALKLRDAMYETYEEDDEEEEEEEEYRPRSASRRSGFRSKSYDEDDDEEDDDEDEDDDDEDDDDDDEDRSPRRRLGRTSAHVKDADMSRRSADEGVRRERKAESAKAAKTVKTKATKEVTYEEDEDLTVDGAVASTPKKKKNFVIDDEDFSFEFLNLD